MELVSKINGFRMALNKFAKMRLSEQKANLFIFSSESIFNEDNFYVSFQTILRITRKKFDEGGNRCPIIGLFG
jgi:hypothetical protein